MKRLVKSFKIRGTIDAPPSKSHLQRLLAASHLSREPVRIETGMLCDDCKAALGIIRDLGSVVSGNQSSRLLIENPLPRNRKAGALHCGESGLGVRMFSPLASLQRKKIVLNGKGSLLKRPVDMLIEPLRSLGVEVTTNSGFMPVELKGPLQGGGVTLDGSISSQFLTGMLLALPVVKQDSVLLVDNLKSKPYIDLTLQVLKDFAIRVDQQDYKRFFIPGGQKYIPPAEVLRVEGDWSGAAFWLVAGAVAGEVTVKGLYLNSAQADRAIIQALRKCGAELSLDSGGIRVSRGILRSFEFDARDCPDLFPPLVALASHCRGTSVIRGTERLIHKESHRTRALEVVFQRMGIDLKVEHDLMKVRGGQKRSSRLDSFGDHRIAMAAAIGAIGIPGGVEISGSDCVNKSYPRFWRDFTRLGGMINE